MISADNLGYVLDVMFSVGFVGLVFFALAGIPCLLRARSLRRRMPLSSRLSRAIDWHWYTALLRGEHRDISDSKAHRALSAYRYCLLGCMVSLGMSALALALYCALRILH